MQHKLQLCFLFLLINSSIVYGQSLTNDVISAANGTGQSSQASVSWIIGEPVSETFVGSSSILSQGFYQPKLFVGIEQDFSKDNSIRVFPNPTSDFVIITSNNPKRIICKMYDASGKIIIMESINASEKKIAMNNFCKGNYLLSLIDENNRILKTFKIIKKD